MNFYLLIENYIPKKYPTIKYNHERSNKRYMGWSNLVIGSHAIHNVAKAYANILNTISTFLGTNPPTDIIKN